MSPSCTISALEIWVRGHLRSLERHHSIDRMRVPVGVPIAWHILYRFWDKAKTLVENIDFLYPHDAPDKVDPVGIWP